MSINWIFQIDRIRTTFTFDVKDPTPSHSSGM